MRNSHAMSLTNGSIYAIIAPEEWTYRFRKLRQDREVLFLCVLRVLCGWRNPGGHSSMPSRRESAGKYWNFSPFSGLKGKGSIPHVPMTYDARNCTFRAQKPHKPTKLDSLRPSPHPQRPRRPISSHASRLCVLATTRSAWLSPASFVGSCRLLCYKHTFERPAAGLADNAPPPAGIILYILSKARQTPETSCTSCQKRGKHRKHPVHPVKSEANAGNILYILSTSEATT